MIARYRTKAIEDIIGDRYTPEDYPVLRDQIEKWKVLNPFDGLKLLDATPVFSNTLIKHLALIRAGACLTVGISDNIAHDPKILDVLQNAGVQVVNNKQKASGQDLILDCAACFSHWKARLGYVELTRSGVELYAQKNKRVFVADSGKIKRIETVLGTGESYFRAMKELGYTQWNNTSLVVFGSGKVGCGIALYALKLGARVTVVSDLNVRDDQLPPVDAEYIAFTDRQAVGVAVKKAYAVVMATGIAGSFQKDCPQEYWKASKALLANMGVEDEFGPDVPEARVLMHKKTLNFMLDEPTHLRYIDPTMALHNRGAGYLLYNTETTGMIEPPATIEEELLSICKSKGKISDEIADLFVQK